MLPHRNGSGRDWKYLSACCAVRRTGNKRNKCNKRLTATVVELYDQSGTTTVYHIRAFSFAKTFNPTAGRKDKPPRHPNSETTGDD